MAENERVRELICVHCKKPFGADILGSNTELAGVKCPHCRLFMPLERVAPDDRAA
jgi:DNA-directed RNA polymerase subunit RPC12/RpoP